MFAVLTVSSIFLLKFDLYLADKLTQERKHYRLVSEALKYEHDMLNT